VSGATEVGLDTGKAKIAQLPTVAKALKHRRWRNLRARPWNLPRCDHSGTSASSSYFSRVSCNEPARNVFFEMLDRTRVRDG